MLDDVRRRTRRERRLGADAPTAATAATDPRERRIAINTARGGQPAGRGAGARARARARPPRPPRRTTRRWTTPTEELVAESVALTVCGFLGLDTAANSIPYLAVWSEHTAGGRVRADRRARRPARPPPRRRPRPDPTSEEPVAAAAAASGTRVAHDRPRTARAGPGCGVGTGLARDAACSGRNPPRHLRPAGARSQRSRRRWRVRSRPPGLGHPHAQPPPHQPPRRADRRSSCATCARSPTAAARPSPTRTTKAAGLAPRSAACRPPPARTGSSARSNATASQREVEHPRRRHRVREDEIAGHGANAHWTHTPRTRS